MAVTTAFGDGTDDDLDIADCHITARGQAALELIRLLNLWRTEGGQSRTESQPESDVHELVEADDTTLRVVRAIQELVLILIDERKTRQ